MVNEEDSVNEKLSAMEMNFFTGNVKQGLADYEESLERAKRLEKKANKLEATLVSIKHAIIDKPNVVAEDFQAMASEALR